MRCREAVRIHLVAVMMALGGVMGIGPVPFPDAPVTVMAATQGTTLNSTFSVTPPTSSQPYLMAFHVCVNGATDCDQPSNHKVWLAASTDGTTFQTLSGWQAFSGSVPDVFRRGNTLYLASSSTAAPLSKIDLTTGAVTAHQMTVTRSGGSNAFARDIAFAGQLPDGRFVITYVPPMQEVDSASNDRVVYLATEVAGSDGTNFAYSGTAITIDKRTLPVTGDPTDPDIHWNGTAWVLYVSVGASTVAYTSSSLTGPYDLSTQTLVSSLTGGVPSATLTADGSQLLVYVNSGTTRSNISIRRAVVSKTPGLISSGSFTTILSGTSYGGTSAESPGVALNVAGTSCATCSTSTTTGTPGAPTNLQASVSGTTVSLQWSAPTTGAAVTEYILEAGSASGESNLFNASVGSVRSLSSPVANGTYFVRVRGRNASGTGTASNEASFTVGSLSAPGAPSGLSATTNGTLLTLQWTAPTSGGAVGDYVLEAGRTSGASDLFNGTVGTGTSISSQVAAGTYFLRVRARNAAGTSTASNEAQATVASPAPPGAPSALTASATGSVLSVRWSAPSSGGTVADYLLEVGRTSGATDLYNASVGPSTSVSAPVASGTYFLRARARNAAGTGPASNEAQVVVGGCVAPSAPTNVTGSLSAGLVKLQWSAVSGATSYVVRAGTSPGTSTLFNGNVGAETVVTAPVASGFSAYIRIHAVNSCGESSASSEVWVR